MDGSEICENSPVTTPDTTNSVKSDYIVLVSKEGYQFYIKEEYATKSGTIRNMLEGQGPFVKTESRTIKFEEIPYFLTFNLRTHILEKVCEYLLYKHHYSTRSSDVIPEFPIPPEFALDLVVVANFLDC